MPEISRFASGVVIRMFHDDHNPPHFHAEHSGDKAAFDFHGNLVKGGLSSRTAMKQVRKWAKLHTAELEENWRCVGTDQKFQKIQPLP